MSDLFYNTGKSLARVGSEDKAAAERAGWTPVTEDQFLAAKGAASKDDNPLAAAGEGFVKGAVDTFTAPARAAVGVADVLGVPRNDWTDSIANIGDNALGALAELTGRGKGEEEIQASRRRAEDNPISHGAGSLAGALAGFGPVGAIGGAARGAVGNATGAAIAGGAAEGATLSLADATSAAREQDSALTLVQALGSVGLGGLFGGTLNLAGKKVGQLLATRTAERAGLSSPAVVDAGIPDLEVPAGRARAPGGPSIQGVGPEMPDLELPATGRPTVPAPPTTNAEVMGGMGAPLEREGGMGLRAPRAPEMPESATVRAPPMTNADVMSGMNFPGEGMMAQRARYAPDVEGGIGGLPGGPDVTEDLAKAGRGEAIHMARRAAKVERILEIVPEGASPDWVLKMTPAQRNALADFVGVSKPSDSTWRTLADAVSMREGIPISEDLAAATEHLKDDGLEDLLRASIHGEGAEGTLAAKVGAPRNGTMLPPAPAAETPVPNAPEPGKFQGASFSPVPEAGYQQPTPGTFPAPGNYQGPVPGGPATEDVIGVSMAAPSPGEEPARTAWDGLMQKVAKHAARRIAGKAIGGILGGSHGPAGVALGMAAGHLVDGLLGSSNMQRIAAKGTSRLEEAIGGLFSGGEKTAVVKSPFLAGHPSPEAAFVARAEEIRRMTPEKVIDNVSKSFGGLDDPAAINAAIQTAQRGLEYLVAKMPPHGPDPGSLTPMSDTRVPERSEIARWGLIHDAITHPETVDRDIRAGTVLPEQLQALKAVYPPRYEQAQALMAQRLVDRDSKKKPIDASQRYTAGSVLGVSPGIDDPKFAIKYGPGFAKGMQQQQPSTGTKGSGRQLRGKSVVAPSLGTQTSSMLAPY